MAITIKDIPRKFSLDGKITLPDPNPSLSVKEVMDLYSNQYPELNNATIEGPVIKKETQLFTFKINLGEKG